MYIYKVESPDKDKLDTLKQLLLSFGEQSTIVFLNYRDAVQRTANFLMDAGFSVSFFHGGMEQKNVKLRFIASQMVVQTLWSALI